MKQTKFKNFLIFLFIGVFFSIPHFPLSFYKKINIFPEYSRVQIYLCLSIIYLVVLLISTICLSNSKDDRNIKISFVTGLASFTSINHIKLSINTNIETYIYCIDVIIFISNILFAFLFFILPQKIDEYKISKLSENISNLKEQVNQLVRELDKLSEESDIKSIKKCIKNKFCK